MQASITGGEGKARLTALALLLGAAPSLQAGEFAYGLGYTATRSDNVTRIPEDGISDTIHSYLIGFYYRERSANLDATVAAQSEFRDYQKDTFDDETVSDVKALLYWTISPQRFIWTVENTFEQRRINAAAADTPDNRTNVNVFNTGPDVYFRFGPVHTLALGARAGHVYTGLANTDNDRFSGSARWLYQSTAISTYSVNYEVLDVNFSDSTANTDYTSQEAFLRADYRPSRSQYTIDIGATRISQDQGEDLEESLLRLTWIRQLTTESNFGLSASGEYSDTAADLLTASTTPLPSPDPTSGDVTSDFFYAKRANLFYNRRGSRFGIDFSLYAQDLDYETTPQDRKEHGGRLQLAFFLSGTTTLSLITEQDRAEYREFVRRDTDRDSSVRLDYRMTRQVTLSLEGWRTERASTIPTAEYVDNRVYLSVLYSSNPLFTPVTAR